ncbi:MAG: ATP-binding cassette domain-containing protein [Clostridiales bacterium]|jgi:ABC-2 type transport system ATP-binding protein|nr:ATP-binding cassette domain-containing protein [Clostridiales bacterium]
MMGNSMAVEIRNLCKSFKQNEVLKDLDLSVPKGKIFALLGQNGAGKTTMVKILSTLLKFDSGHINVLSHELPKQSDSVRSKISMTGQYVALDEDLTGEQNLILIARLSGYNSIQAKGRTKELLEMFDLSDAGKKTVKTYSGGMHRRLDIAAGIIKTPELLFLDEPTTGLDPRSRSVVWDFVRGLAHNGTTIFLTTQYLEEADRLADLIAVIEGGKIVAKGTPTELKSLVGRKTVSIRFKDTAERESAKKLVSKSFPNKSVTEHESDLFSIEISDISQANSILNGLADASIEPVEYSISQASLDEVFLTFTGGKTNE